MDLIHVLSDDHVYFRGRFHQLQTLARTSEMADDKPLIRSLVKDFRRRHQIHLRRETEVLIPALLEVYRRKKIKPADAFLLQHLQEEHLTVGRNVYLLAQALDVRPLPPLWVKHLESLVAAYLPHMDREEKGLFPEAEKCFSLEQLEKMARVSVGED